MFGREQEAPRPGLLRRADGSSLLLTDFNEASPSFLRRLMQALIDGEAAPVDSGYAYPVDIRVLATTTVVGGYGQQEQDLLELGAEVDLTSLAVPPLRERREDIPLLISHCLQYGFPDSDVQFSNKAMQLLLAADWPGNVRHLLNVVKQCVRLTKTRIISEALVSSRIKSDVFNIQPLSNAQRDFEREYLTELLKVTNGNVTRAASLAKRNRTEIHRLLKKHKIEAKSFRQ